MLEITICTLINLVLIGTSFYVGFRLGNKSKPTQEFNKDSLKYLNQFLNLMNYTGKGGK